jgi:hypothetical protein
MDAGAGFTLYHGVARGEERERRRPHAEHGHGVPVGGGAVTAAEAEVAGEECRRGLHVGDDEGHIGETVSDHD